MRVLIFICTCLFFVIPSQARTITVDDDGPADFNNIQAAIDDANDGDDIVIADGIYTGIGNQDLDFLGKAIIVRSENGPESCIIDCQNLGRAFYFHSGEDANSILDGFTVTNGSATSGGAIRCSGSSPVIANCIVTGSHAGTTSGSGGGIECSEGSPLITDCVITGNSAGWVGGAIFCGEYSSPAITNCTITGNSAGSYGGAIGCWDADPTVINCTIVGNSAGSQAGGIQYCSAASAIINCIIWDNAAPSFPQGVFSTNLAYNCIQDTVYGGEGNINEDPCFVQPGHWNANDVWIEGDYHLLKTSPCIDAGYPSYNPGPNETDLDGNPRLTGCAVDIGAYEYPLPLVAQIHIQPRTINLQSEGKSLTCRISLPAGYNAADIDPDTVFLENEIEPASFRTHNGARSVLAFFNRRELQGIVDSGRVELTITGQLTDGTAFAGKDTIKVIDSPPPKPAGTRKPKVNHMTFRNTKSIIG